MPKRINFLFYSLKVQLMQKPAGGLGRAGDLLVAKRVKKLQIAVILKVTSRLMWNAQ